MKAAFDIDQPILLPWRLVWGCVAYIGRIIFCVSVYLMWFKLHDFKRAWRDTE